jgi:hypothetical protein
MSKIPKKDEPKTLVLDENVVLKALEISEAPTVPPPAETPAPEANAEIAEAAKPLHAALSEGAKIQATPIPDAPSPDAEEGIADKIKNLLGGWFGGSAKDANIVEKAERSTLEIRQMLIDETEKALRPHRRRGSMIPFNYAIIHIVEASPAIQHQIVSAIDDLSPKLHDAVMQRLRSGRYEVPRDFAIEPRIYPTPPPELKDAFKENTVFIELTKQRPQSTHATIHVLKGSAVQDSFVLKANQTYNIGRIAMIENERGHLVRKNDLFFHDPLSLAPTDPNRSINDTVSRFHARIEFDPIKNKFIFVNEQGSTGFFRDSLRDTQKLKPNQSVPMQTGDMFYLGNACIRFE